MAAEVILDEPSLGLAPFIIKEIFRTILDLNQQGITALLVEQMALIALAISNRAYVLELGQIKMERKGLELAQNPDVKKAYLGA